MSAPLKKRPLKPLHWAELEGFERPPYLVKRVLNDNALSVLYGEPGVMKTFVTLDLALHVAMDKPWHGQRVHGGPVVYVACEGGRSIEDRLAAFCQHHGIERANVPFHVLPETVNLGAKDGDAAALVEAVGQIGDVKLIVIDTLSRALFGGNENSPDDMGTFVACCDAIRRKTGAHVLIIHHTGKDTERGARGHSSLKAAADTELVVKKSEGVTLLETTKQRDLAEGFEIGFRWHVVKIGVDEDDDPIESLVLEPTDERPAPEEKLTNSARTALDILWTEVKSGRAVRGGSGGPPIGEHLHGVSLKDWRELCDAAPLSTGKSRNAAGNRFRDAKERLLKTGKIGEGDGWVWPCPKDDAGGQDEIPF